MEDCTVDKHSVKLTSLNDACYTLYITPQNYHERKENQGKEGKSHVTSFDKICLINKMNKHVCGELFSHLLDSLCKNYQQQCTKNRCQRCQNNPSSH